MCNEMFGDVLLKFVEYILSDLTSASNIQLDVSSGEARLEIQMPPIGVYSA